jgi:NAD(P)-dependent dehydrogenase (short-subunit alcohol dehydrogenase family)
MAPQPLVAHQLLGKKVIVIGGTSGIGFAVASALVEEGATVIVASSSASRVENAVARLSDPAIQYNADKARVSGHTVNLKGPGMETSIAALFEKVGTVDHIVHTAGETLAAAPADTPLDRLVYDDVLAFAQVRFLSVIFTAKIGARHLSKGGSMVFTSGAGAVKPSPNWVASVGFMSGLYGLTRQLAYDLSAKHFRVNLVSPGLLKTELWDDLDAETREKLYEQAAGGHLTRHTAEPHEVAQAYLYLLKDTNMSVAYFLMRAHRKLTAHMAVLARSSQLTRGVGSGLLREVSDICAHAGRRLDDEKAERPMVPPITCSGIGR